jgi:hypothetical protein
VLNKVTLQPFHLLILSCIWRISVISYFLIGRASPQNPIHFNVGA